MDVVANSAGLENFQEKPKIDPKQPILWGHLGPRNDFFRVGPKRPGTVPNDVWTLY